MRQLSDGGVVCSRAITNSGLQVKGSSSRIAGASRDRICGCDLSEHVWSLNLQFWSDEWLNEEMSFRPAVKGGGAGEGDEDPDLMIIEDGSESESDGKATALPGSPLASTVAEREEVHTTKVIIRTAFEYLMYYTGMFFSPIRSALCKFFELSVRWFRRKKLRPSQNRKLRKLRFPQMTTKSLNQNFCLLWNQSRYDFASVVKTHKSGFQGSM